jgi:hypothetical protein
MQLRKYGAVILGIIRLGGALDSIKCYLTDSLNKSEQDFVDLASKKTVKRKLTGENRVDSKIWKHFCNEAVFKLPRNKSSLKPSSEAGDQKLPIKVAPEEDHVSN